MKVGAFRNDHYVTLLKTAATLEGLPRVAGALFDFRQRTVAWGGVLVLSLGLSACSTDKVESRLPDARVEQKRENHTLAPVRPGETIDVFVMEDESFNGRYLVRESGDAILPKVGRVTVAGLSLREAEDAVKRALQASQLKKATVIVDRSTITPAVAQGEGTAVVMAGNVVRPGRVHVPVSQGRPAGVYDVVMQSGGFARFADTRRVEVMRKDAGGRIRRMHVDFEKIKGGQVPDVPIQEGDIITVPEKWIGF